MSRFTVSTEEYFYDYGYDPPCQEFFIHRRLPNPGPDDDEVEYAIANRFTTKCHPNYPGRLEWTNSQLLELIDDEKIPIPRRHVTSIALDVAF